MNNEQTTPYVTISKAIRLALSEGVTIDEILNIIAANATPEQIDNSDMACSGRVNDSGV